MKKLFTLMLCLLSISGVQTIKAADEIYAVLNSDKQTMTLYYDEHRVSRGGVTDWWSLYNSNVSGYSVRTVILHASMADARPVSTNSWFCDFKSLTDIQHLNFLNTSYVEDMSSMFKNCQSLTSIDVSGFDIWMVGLMDYMFYDCKELTTIYCNSNNWRRHGAWSEKMFQGCVKLVGGNGTAYNSAHVDISYAQEDTDSDPGYFTAVPEIYIVPSDDKKTLTMYYDYQCEARSGWKYWQKGEAVNGTWEFYGEWEKYTTNVILDVSMKEAHPTSTSKWFGYFSKLQVIEHLDYLNTSNVTDMSSMFEGCYGLTSLDVSKFNTSNATNMSSMFENCHGLTSLNVSKFNTSNVRHMSSMFENCSGLTSLNVSKLNTSNVRHMSSMFEGCYGLTSLDVSKFNTSNVTNMSSMFKNCYGLTSLDVSKFNTSNVTDMSSMFEGCYGLNFLDLLNFDTQKVERINYLFKDCESLIMICCKEDMTSLPTEYQLTYIFQGIEYTETVQNDNLFTNCNKLVGANGTAYSSEHTGLEYARPDKEGQPGYFSTEAKDINKELTGLFTINSEGKQIVFSKGNLQYKASINEWRFAANQYAIIGEANANIAANYNGWIDLFGWGTGNNPTLASTNSAAYATFTDWGMNTISNGGTYNWRTLTMEEWDYLINQRPADKRGPAVIAGINGFVLLPDEWTLPSGVSFDPVATNEADNTFTAEEWTKMEENGAVFLPCAGMRSDKETNTTVNHSNKVGIYWSSSPYNTDDPSHENYAQSVYIMSQYIIDNCNPYSNGLSVRLVHDTWPEGIEDVQRDKAQSTKVIRDGVLLIERNGKTYNAQGAEVK